MLVLIVLFLHDVVYPVWEGLFYRCREDEREFTSDPEYETDIE